MKPIQLTAVLALAFAPFAFAQEGLREKMNDLEKRAQAAQAEGREEEAQKLRKAVDELAARYKVERAEHSKREAAQGEKVSRDEVRDLLEKSRRELEIASKEGREDAVEKLKRHISDLEAKVGKEKQHDEPKKIATFKKLGASGKDDPQQRLQHLGEAIEHLHAAGLHEPAERLSDQARALKKELTQKSGDGESKGPNLEKQLAEVRDGMMNLQRQVQEMQKRLEELSRERK